MKKAEHNLNRYSEYLLIFLVLVSPTIFYWIFIENCEFWPSTNPKDWADFASFFGGINGPLISAVGIFYLIKQIRKSEESNTTALKSFVTAQEVANFEFFKFQFKILKRRIISFNSLDLDQNPSFWATTFQLILYDLVEIESSYRQTVDLNTTQTAIQTMYSQLANWLLKVNFEKYKYNKKLFFKEQHLILSEQNFKNIDDNINKIKSSVLHTVGSDEPDYL